LNVDQALADLAYFIETKKRERNLQTSPVIVFGGSYAGNMAAWARLKYPHLIQVRALLLHLLFTDETRNTSLAGCSGQQRSGSRKG